jgi:hypothetical protein
VYRRGNMKKRVILLIAVAVFSGTAVFLMSNHASGDPITVNKPFHFRDNRSANSVGFRPGDFLTFGAQSVIPNGDNGTTGEATQGSTHKNLTFYNYCVSPNFFAWSVRYDSSLTGQWNLTFTNGQDTASAVTPSVGNASLVPFAFNVAISGSGLTPTFSWTFPDGFTPDGVRIQIWDLQNPVANLRDVIHAQNFQGNPGSFTVPSTFSCGKALEPGHHYSLEISPALTRGVPLGDNTTIVSRSRSFFDFVPLEPSAPPNVVLPTVIPGPTPAYSFHTTVVGGQTIFIDPPVAIGYDYAIGSGDPNFASVTLPTGIGDNLFDLYLFDGTNWVFKTHLTGGNTYTFDPGGVDRFRILGIEPSTGLDPQNPTAFITGLTFMNSGEFTGTMTPLINFSMTLYDDFSGTYIDKTKWSEGEWVREIDTTNHRLLMKQASPSPTAIDGYPYNDNNNLGFADPDSVNSMQADVTLLQNTVTNNGHTRARLMGRFYNDGTPGGGMIGDIQAEISLRMEPTGLVAYWYVNKNINFDGTNSTKLKSGNFTTPINIGTTYTLSIAYDGAETFTFKIGNETVTAGPSGIPARVSSASSPVKVLSTRVQVDDATSSGYVSAAFDNVLKNSIPYDDFSSSVIDPAKWTSYEFVREISEGKLRLGIRSSWASASTSHNRLEFVDPSSINVLRAKVTPLTYQNNQGEDIVARMGGRYYNDGTPGGGFLGEVGADVRIGETEVGPVGHWNVWNYIDATDENDTKTIAAGQFAKPISLNNTYTLLLGWDGGRLIFGLDDEVVYYTPTTSINPPNLPWKELGVRVKNPVGKEAIIEASFDEVMVGGSCCPAIDVNPQTIDFGKVLPGGTSDQTVTVTNVGSVTLTLGTIGSPSAPFSITGGTCTNNQTLATQGSCSLIIRFAPTAYGVFTSSFSIPSDDPAQPIVTVDPVNGTSPDHFTLTVSKSGTGNGTVTSSPAGINCGSSCTEDVQPGKKITLKAKADTNSTFTGWSGGGCTGTKTCTVTVNTAVTVTADFALKIPDISVAQTSLDFGSVKLGKKVTKTLKIGNNGSGDLMITLSGLEETDFSIQGSSSVTIKGKKSYTLKVLFTPKSSGPKAATLGITSNDPDTPTINISLSGTAQ